MEPTAEQKAEYIAIRNGFHQKRDRLRSWISNNEKVIDEHRRTISDLEKQIREARPRIEGADKICDRCDIVSMKYTHTVPGQGERERWYQCQICGHKNYHL